MADGEPAEAVNRRDIHGAFEDGFARTDPAGLPPWGSSAFGQGLGRESHAGIVTREK